MTAGPAIENERDFLAEFLGAGFLTLLFAVAIVPGEAGSNGMIVIVTFVINPAEETLI